jgi:P2 family phage contractile tail tube protein
MANTIYIMETVNLFCGDDDPENSKHLTLDELKLPDLSAMYVDHTPGGAPVGIEIEVGINKLEPTFKLKGFDFQLLRQFGLGSRQKHRYTAYGAIRDKRSGRLLECIAVLEARLGKVESEALKRGEAAGHDYSLNEVTHYELSMDGSEEFYWDFWTNTLRVGGESQNGESNRILRIPN